MEVIGEPPVLTPSAAAVLLRILTAASLEAERDQEPDAAHRPVLAS